MVRRFLHVPCELSGRGLTIGHTVQCEESELNDNFAKIVQCGRGLMQI